MALMGAKQMLSCTGYSVMTGGQRANDHVRADATKTNPTDFHGFLAKNEEVCLVPMVQRALTLPPPSMTMMSPVWNQDASEAR